MFNDYQDHLLDEQLRELFDEQEAHMEGYDDYVASMGFYGYHDANDIHGDPEFRDSSDIVG